MLPAILCSCLVAALAGWAIVVEQRRRTAAEERAGRLEVMLAAAERGQARLEAVLETATDAIHVLDERGDVVLFSESFARLLGYSNEETARLNLTAWTPLEHMQDFTRTIAAASERVEVVETGVRRRDGTMVDVELSSKRMKIHGSTLLYRSARDVSERRRADREIQSNLAELERINRELDEFVYVASHDLRSPLRAIRSLAQWIIDDDPSVGPATGERLRVIQARAQRMTQLLDDVMIYARIGKAGELAGPLMSAAALIAEIAVTLQVPNGYRILADRSLDSVMVQRAPLEQVIHNLIGNSIKHHDRNQGSVRIWVVDIGERHRFFVADDGPGIPEPYRESVFEMFTTLKPRDEVEGSGMGLALVRKVVKQMGGQCAIQDTPGRGTCLWFDWPRQH